MTRPEELPPSAGEPLKPRSALSRKIAPFSEESLTSLGALWRQIRRTMKSPLVPILPAHLMDAYARLRAQRFRQYIGLAINTTVMTLVIHEAAAFAIPQVLDAIPPRSLVATIFVELFIWLASRRVASLAVLQFLAVGTFLAPLLLLFQYQALDISYYLIIMFVMGFLMPWNAIEVVWVGSLPVMAFIGAHIAARNLEGTANETFILFVSTVIIFSLQLMQEQERQQRFIHESEAESTRIELLDSLKLAARLHAEMIADSRDYGPIRARVHYEPMQQLGGDFVRIESLGEEMAAILVADVTGHGAPSALMVNRLNSQVEALMAKRCRPHEAAMELNKFIVRNFEGTCIFMTGIWAEYDAPKRLLRWSNYGHPPPFLIEAATHNVRRLAGGVPPMGFDATLAATETTAGVEPGDVIIFYTDGLIEMLTRSGMFGLEGLQSYLREGVSSSQSTLTADDVIARLARAVRSRRVGEAKDDLLMIAWEILR